MENLRHLLQYHRPQSMYDSEVHKYIGEILQTGENFAEDPEKLWSEFKDKFDKWIHGSKLNTLHNLDRFADRDIIMGVTHYLDDIHQMLPNVCVLEHEYRYHDRLYGDSLVIRTPESIQPDDNLIISLPFPRYGDIHPDMDEIVNVCNRRGANIHIDACWYGCSRDIVFDLGEPCIKSVAFSLSKALGLGANRVGVRYARKRWTGPVTIMNYFDMTPQILVWMGIKFIDRFGSDFWQNKYGDAYQAVCRELNLQPTKAIHVAWDNGSPCGVRPLLRKLVK